jgi:alkylhydroperoxidase family enzyme
MRELGAVHFLASLVLARSRSTAQTAGLRVVAVLVGRRSKAARELVVRRQEASSMSRRVGETPLHVQLDQVLLHAAARSTSSTASCSDVVDGGGFRRF